VGSQKCPSGTGRSAGPRGAERAGCSRNVPGALSGHGGLPDDLFLCANCATPACH
jgi:hypothetical protein